MHRFCLFILHCSLVILFSGCSATTPPAAEVGQAITFKLTSPAFDQGQAIPAQYTCNGAGMSPPLRWTDPPTGAQSLALIMDDPDAPGGTWVHWVLFNLPADLRELPEQAALPAESSGGKNGWGRTDYGGPCPPGGTHRYFFKLYALDTKLDLPAGASKNQLLTAMQDHILGQTELMGTYAQK